MPPYDPLVGWHPLRPPIECGRVTIHIPHPHTASAHRIRQRGSGGVPRKIEKYLKITQRDKQEKEMPLIEVDGEQMMQCENCGNIWDGYAQCNCWQWDYPQPEEDSESGYDTA